MAVLAGEKTVTTAGQPEALAMNEPATHVLVQAKHGNTDSIFIGNSTAQRVELNPGQSIALTPDDLNEVFIDANVSGEGVNYIGSD